MSESADEPQLTEPQSRAIAAGMVAGASFGMVLLMKGLSAFALEAMEYHCLTHAERAALTEAGLLAKKAGEMFGELSRKIASEAYPQKHD